MTYLREEIWINHFTSYADLVVPTGFGGNEWNTEVLFSGCHSQVVWRALVTMAAPTLALDLKENMKKDEWRNKNQAKDKDLWHVSAEAWTNTQVF